MNLKNEELDFELQQLREETARLKLLVEKTVALLADAGDEAASFAMYFRLQPMSKRQEWRDTIDRDAEARHEWRTKLGTWGAGFVGW